MTPSYREIASEIRKVLLGGAKAPARSVLAIPGGHLLVMPAADREYAVVKTVVVDDRGVSGEVWARRHATGEVWHLPAEELTVRRTAALSLLAAKTLAPRKKGALLLVGAGRQARGHLEAFAEAGLIDRVLVKGRNPERARALAAYAEELGVNGGLFEGWYPEDLAFVVTATTSPRPVVGADLPEGVFIAAVGSFTKNARELPPELLERASLVVADTEDALFEAGELVELPPKRVLTLREVLENPPATSGTVVFKSTGHALFDLAAVRAYLKA